MKQQRVLKWAALAVALLVVIGLSGWALSRWKAAPIDKPEPVDKITAPVKPSTYQFKTAWMKEEATVVYPAAAIRDNLEGSVVLSMMIEADGKIASSKVYETSGSPDLDQAAIDASHSFDIDPGQLGADAFPFEKLLKMTFRLESIAPQ